MYGAIPYLMTTFALDRERAFQIVCDWLDSQVDESGDSSRPSPRVVRRPARTRAA